MKDDLVIETTLKSRLCFNEIKKGTKKNKENQFIRNI